MDTAFPKTPLYEATLTAIPTKFSHLLKEYAHIPPDEQISHVQVLRDQAYISHPYPCLGRFRFMDLDLSNHPLYSSVLSQLKVGSPGDELFLDLGCCLGQDIRQLLLDGADPAKLYGADLIPEFVQVGYTLFKDESRLSTEHFLTPADAFDTSESNRLAVLDGKISFLHSSAVFHLFGLDKQQALAKRCLQLLNKNRKCLVLGGQTANLVAGEYARNERRPWRHNAESWTEMWKNAAKEHGDCLVDVSVTLEKREDGPSGSVRSKIIGPEEEGFRWMVWSVEVKFGG